MIDDFNKSIFVSKEDKGLAGYHEVFYKKTVALVLLSNLIIFTAFSFYDYTGAFIFGISNLIIAYFHVVCPCKNQSKNKVAVNVALYLEAVAINVYLPREFASVWFFSIASFFTWSQFYTKEEKNTREVLLFFSVLSFCIWNFLPDFFNLNYSREELRLFKSLFRINSFTFSLVTVIFWIRHSEKILSNLVNERDSLNRILDSLPVMVVSKDISDGHKVLYMNSMSEKVFGNKKETLYGKNDSEIVNFTPSTLDKFHNIESKALENNKTISFKNFEIEKRNGIKKYINLTNVPIDENCVVSISQDVTENVSFNKQLENYKFALDASAIVSFTDKFGNITYANEKFCEISGYDYEELVGQNHRILKSEFHDKEFYDNLWKQISSKKVWVGEIANKTKSGKIYWVHSTIIPSTNLNGEIESFFSIRFDITARKEAEERAIQSEKMTVLGEMAAGIFHEINNPLTIIKTKSQLIQKGVEKNTLDNEKLVAGLHLMEENINRISKIIKGLKSYSRNADHDPFERTSVKDLVSDSLVLCHDKIKHSNVNLINEVIDEQLFIDCRKSEIIQIIVNLINNSIDAVDAKENAWVKVSCSEIDNHYQLKIIDSGNGIPVNIVEKLMTPFFTTKAPGKGTGLGLSISRKIAKAHGGELKYDYDSENTCFILDLPKSPEEIKLVS